jgi:DNA-binding HxlR family transcriptional regulator
MNKKSSSKTAAKPPGSLRSTCPVACTLDILGDKWTLVIVKDMFLGKSTYTDFLKSSEGIPTNILADRLKRLEHNGIASRQQYQHKPVRYAYHLTDKGKDLGPILLAVVEWSNKHLSDTIPVVDISGLNLLHV